MQITRRNKNRKGFTLIELLVVIAIIGLLASVLLVSMNKSRVKARDTQRYQDAMEFRKALDLYYQDHGTYPIAGMSEGMGYPLYDAFANTLIPNYLPNLSLDTFWAWNYGYGNGGQDYGLLVPYEQFDGGRCKYRTPGGSQNGWWSAVDCPQ